MMRRYLPTDAPTLEDWLAARNMGSAEDLRGVYSDTGYIVEGVAAGFAYATNADVVYLDNFIANPGAPAAAVHAAFMRIVDALLVLSRELGAKVIIAVSRHAGIIKMGERYGFAVVGKDCAYMARRA